MNTPPKDFVKVTEGELRKFIETCLRLRELDAAHAELMARLLTDCDLRGVHSHGLNRLPMYCRDLKAGDSNPSPNIRIVKETPAFVIIDGDGGIGYLPMVRTTEKTVEKAKASGIALGMARHIGHYGAAGIYTRMCAETGCIGFSVQGSSPKIFPDAPVATLGSPPMSFAFPASSGPPVVSDFNTRLFGQDEMDLFERIPSAFFKGLGLTLTSKILGGALTGHMLDEGREIESRYPSHFGGGVVIAIDPGLFVPKEEFYREVDRFHDDIAAQMKPMPGYGQARLPGAVEAEFEKKYRREGIPVSREIAARIEPLAAELGVPCPWG